MIAVRKNTPPKNTTINLRVAADIKKEAGEILASMGLTFSEAFNLMLHQVRLQQGLPFKVVAYGHIPQPETLALINRIENGKEELTGPFSSKEELWNSLDI
jgi:addiction module RelB/DinJ family antitoxin